MSSRAAVVSFALILILAGALECFVSPPFRAAATTATAAATTVDPQLKQTGTRATQLFQARRYNEAAALAREALPRALALRDRGTASRLLVISASSAFANFQFREALTTYLDARRLAESAGDWQAAAAISLNISSLHFLFAELDGAAFEARHGLDCVRKSRHDLVLRGLLAQLAKVELASRGVDAAFPQFADALAAADAAGDTNLASQTWNYYGHELLRARRLREADRALSNAFRLRKLAGGGLDACYRTLAELRLAQKDPRSAEVLADLAVQAGAGRASWAGYYWRGRARSEQGRLSEALRDYRSAITAARQWRLEALPADAHRAGIDAGLHDLYAGLIETANREYALTGRETLARESFDAAEESRAAGLRSLMLEGGHGAQRDSRYSRTLQDLRAAESRALAGDPAAADDVRRFRYRLIMLELEAGLGAGDTAPAERTSLSGEVQQKLRPGEALLTFHLGRNRSYVWGVTRSRFELKELPGRDALAAAVRDFTAALRSGGDPAAGQSLYSALFGALSAEVREKPDWLLALDGELFDAPLAAVLEDGVPVVERHSLRILPSAHFVADRRPAPALDGSFVGVGDPVYNAADSRCRVRGRIAAELELPRLAASGIELDVSARAWHGAKSILLKGPDADRASLARALATRPSVLHLAAHVLAPEGRTSRASIALSLAERGPDLVTVSDVAALPSAAEVVVLSGCSTAGGAHARGAGLLGLTRAWLVAGAGSVVGTLWPTPDSSNLFFAVFYERLRAGAPVASALREAQVWARRSGKIRPEEWAAYVLVGRG